ncbi:MAG: selenoprotein B, partial [Candidatus Tectomicrobia bacterium]|nr:selenoprotein B [Candidatus Tectomicrobia bacterium]
MAHFIEDEGIATTGISLVRENTAAMRPPRFLWVSFPLGRPLGVPGDAAFQRRVILAALRLLEAEQGPVLEDYPEDIPVAAAAEAQGTVRPIALAPATPATDDDLGALVQQEIDQLAPWHELAVNQRGRTTIGISGLEPREAGRFLAHFLGGISPTSY